MADPIYKVMTEAAFEASWSQGHFTGSADDLRDGFIHFSAAHQLEATLDLATVLWAEPLALAPDGRHILPEGVPA
jgi:uncharacterized protein (DUF952 family)